MELVKIKGNTYILEGPNKVGIYLINKKEVIIIDTGQDATTGEEIMKICQDNKWQIKGIINTHSHPDHVGGNYVIHKTLKIPVYAYGLEKILIENPFLISTIAYGGFPPKYVQNPYLMSTPTKCKDISTMDLPKGLEFFPLPGHSGDMVGFKTKDGVVFLGDALAGEKIITKYKLWFMYDVKAYLESLDYICDIKAEVFIPSHGEICKDIKELVTVNREVVLEVINKIKELCQPGLNFEGLLRELTTYYHVKLDLMQYCLIGGTLKCYLSYLLNEGLIKNESIDNELIWVTV